MYDLADYDIPDEALNLKNLLDSLLAKTVAIYDQLGVPLPLRRYWTMGIPAVDCEQVVVSFIQAYLGLPGDEAQHGQNCDAPRTAVIEIMVSREVPGPTRSAAPSADSIQRGAIPAAIDSWVLIDSMREFDSWGTAPGRGPNLIATVNAPTTQGNFQSVVLQLTLMVP
jgi:hypothetical protein